MELKKTNLCTKYTLPNGRYVDILSEVMDELHKWIQDDPIKPESGGYIVGYEHAGTGNITLENISHPYENDNRNRVQFDIVDRKHLSFLHESSKRQSYYMGVWHTHPQQNPTPSSKDWDDWYETLRLDKTGSSFVFFIICGTLYTRLWAGNTDTGLIEELIECRIDINSLYHKVLS